ncbi:PLP-dependent aminotransferase family protein [Sagittula salina]|uniref:PLP-dependent aminotransferase family protein n=1 Tax=Sagittula salina TaxID=2820268 RepID=A0A940S2T3_9RHOB|nr:PLP-dependent aminotransferase family protein [Sagittula salina]MBP0482015.1 PLP-dependent aminotransferase family protein [Sagittula salina]
MDTIKELYGAQAAAPKYRMLAAAVRQGVAEGRLSEGERLPPVRDLAWQLQITPGTVARAYTILTDEGLLRGEVGRGTFVADRSALSAEEQSAPLVKYVPQASGVTNLFYSRPPDVGQVDLIRASLGRLTGMPAQALLEYPNSERFSDTRQAALRWMSDAVLGPVDEADVVLSHGGQSGVSMVMQTVLRGPTPVVLVEALSYPGFRRAAELCRAKVVTVPMDEQGLIPEALDALTQKHDAQLLCTSAEVHNPTSRFTPQSRREAIADIAARRGLAVLEDDCYRLAPSRAPTYRALLPELGWYVSSVSKSLAPSLRVGFVVAPRRHAAALRRTAEHGFFGLAVPLAWLIADLLARPETWEAVDRLRAATARYVRAAVNLLGGYDVTYSEDVPFLWLRLPEGWRVGAFVQAAEAAGITLRGAEHFVPRDGIVPQAVRISINAHMALDAFEAAITKLRDLLDAPPERLAV